MPSNTYIAKEQQCITFWGLRHFRIVGSYPTDQWTNATELNEQQRLTRQQLKKDRFYVTNNLLETDRQDYNYLTIAQNLSFWAKYSSWTYCDSCKMLLKNNLIPSYKNNTIPKRKSPTGCICSKGRYIIPKFNNIPVSLRSLTINDIITLRPFILHTGDFTRLQHGYRQKNGFCRVSWSVLSVICYP